MTPSIVVDDTEPEVVYVGQQWQAGADPSTFSGTYNVCRTDVNLTTAPPSMIFSFDGTAVSFFGQPTESFKLNYTFDGTGSRVADTNFTRGIPGKTGVRLWGVENVTDTIHTITLIPTAGQPILDYIVVTPGPLAFLGNKILALDDTDSAIKYSGNWTSQSGTVFTTGLAYNDTRHGSTTAGDSFRVTFTGASISVYGLLNQAPGKHSSSYSIDGGPSTTYESSPGTTQPGQQDTWALHQKFFSKDVIPGEHNLTVTIGEVSGSQAFWLDYILFEGISSTTLSPPVPTSTASKQTNMTKIIEGVVITVIVGVILAYCLRCHVRFFRWWRELNENASNSTLPPVPLPVPPVTPPFLTQVGPYRDDNYETRRLRVEMENLRRENETIRLQAQHLQGRSLPVPSQSRAEDAGPADSPPPYNAINYIP